MNFTEFLNHPDFFLKKLKGTVRNFHGMIILAQCFDKKCLAGRLTETWMMWTVEAVDTGSPPAGNQTWQWTMSNVQMKNSPF
jgi:hypothetical protein